MSKRPSAGYLKFTAPPLDPKIAALGGPLELKTPGSSEWIIQITHKAQHVLHSLESSTSEWEKVIEQIEAQQVWAKYPAGKPYGTREAYFVGEFGRPEPELTRAKVEQQLQKKGGQPGNQNAKKDKNEHSNTMFVSRDACYIRARLERDGHTEILAQIEAASSFSS